MTSKTAKLKRPHHYGYLAFYELLYLLHAESMLLATNEDAARTQSAMSAAQVDKERVTPFIHTVGMQEFKFHL